MNDKNVKQKGVQRRGFWAPENRGALFIGTVLLVVLGGAGVGVYSFLTPDADVQVKTVRVDTSNFQVDAGAKTSEAYRDAVRVDNSERYEQAAVIDGGVALPFTFDEEPQGGFAGRDIGNCGCTIDDEQLRQAIKRLGVGTSAESDHMRVAKSDIYLAINGQLMGEGGEPLVFRSSPIFMKSNGQLLDEKSIAVLSKDAEPLYLGKDGQVIDHQTRNIPMLGDLLMSNGTLIVNDGRLAIRPGNMQRVGRSDIYITTEGQLVTMDGKPIRHSGAFVYQNDERKLVNRNSLDVAWEQQSVYQNRTGHLVNVSGSKFSQPGILFSYEGILIDNDGMLTRPLVNIEKVGNSDIYKTKSGSLVDGYGLPITHYGSKVRMGPSSKLLSRSGHPVFNRSRAAVHLVDKGVLRVDVGKGGIQSGILKTSEGIALDDHGQMVTRRGRLERRGSSDIYLTVDGLLTDKNGKVILFLDKDTFIDFSEILSDGSQGLETYDGIRVIDSTGNRVYLTLEGRIVDVKGNSINEVGILSSSDGVLLTSSGKKVVQDNEMERVVTKDGQPITHNGKDVYKGDDGQLFDVDGNPILAPDGRAVFMDDNGNLVDENGSIVDSLELMAGERAVKNGELSTRKNLTTASGEQILHDGKEVFVDSSGRVIDKHGNAVLTRDGREIFVDVVGNIVDKNGNEIDETLLKTESGKVVSSGLVAGREQVTTKEGKAVQFDGKDVFRGHDGLLYDENGKAIRTKDGKRVFIDDKGNMIDEDGMLVKESLLTVAGERVVKSGDLATRKRLTDANGNSIQYGHKDVFIAKDGRLVDESGKLIKTKDGRDLYVDEYGKLVDKNGNKISDELLSSTSEEGFKNGAKTIVRKITSADGSPVLFKGKEVFSDRDGRLLDENGNAIRTSDGREVFVDSNGNLVDKNGNVIRETFLTDATGKKVSSGLEKGVETTIVTNGVKTKVRQITATDGSAVLFKGKEVFSDKDGRLFDENGGVIRTSDGREVFVDANGNLVDKNGNAIEETLLTNASGTNVSSGLSRGVEKYISTSGVKSIKQLIAKDGIPLSVDGKSVFVDGNGRVVDEYGHVIKTKDGREVYVDEYGDLIDENGNSINENILEKIKHRNVMPGEVSSFRQMMDVNGNAMFYDGKEVYTDKEGRLIDENGNVILSVDGGEVFVDANGNLVDQDGNRIKEALLKDVSGNTVSSGLVKGKEKLVTKGGKSIKYRGSNVFKGSDGSLIDKNGNLILTADGKKIFVNKAGELVDENGNHVTDDTFSVEERSYVKESLVVGPEKLQTKDGKELTFEGKNVFKAKDGSLVDARGKSILTKDGKRIFVDSDGHLVDESGDLVDDTRFEAVGKKKVSDGFLKGQEQVTTKDGKSVKYQGKNVYKGSDGSLYDAHGNAILTSDGRKVYMNKNGQIVDLKGNIITESILTADSKPVKSGQLTSIPAREMKKIGSTDIFVTRDGTLIDKDGKAITFNGKKVRVGKNGQLIDENGNSVVDKSGKPVYINEKGVLVDYKGQKVNDSLLADGSGVLLDQNGRSVVDSMKKVGDSDIYTTSAGRLVDRNGAAIRYNDENVYVGDDGRLYYENGKPVTDANGSSVYLDSITGKLVDRNGKSIEGSVLTNSNGTLIDSNGELVTSGGKLKRIPGTDLYRTDDGQVVDVEGKPVMVNGKPVYVDLSGKVVNRFGKAVRFKGQELYFADDGRLVDRNGQPVLDSDNRAIRLSDDGGIVNEDGELVDEVTGRTGGHRLVSNTGFRKTVRSDDSNVRPTRNAKDQQLEKRKVSATPPQSQTMAGSKASAPAGGRRLDKASAERLKRRYLVIKASMKQQLMDARKATKRDRGIGFVAVGGKADSGSAAERGDVGGEASNGSEGSSSENTGYVYRKAGTMLYAVSSFQFNSDYIKNVVVKIVGLPPKHPLYKAKAMGTFELAYDRMVLSFNKVCPLNSECIPMKGVALDPQTSAPALASGVNHHYWYRYGGLFVSSLLEGTSEAMSESGTREETMSITGSNVTTTGLDGDKLALRSLGKVGERFSDVFANRISRASTAWLNPGEEMAIMLFDDIKGELSSASSK